MSELILLCPAAAADPDDADTDSPHVAARLSSAAVVERLRTGSFARVFRRARVVSDTSDATLLPRELPHERWLRARCAVPEADAIEAYSAVSHAMTVPTWRMTPVHVRIGQDQLTVTDPGALALNERHLRMLADAAAPSFAERGLALHAVSDLGWYASCPQSLDWRARAWTMACGRSMDAYLPDGADARFWRRILTEVQMCWHDHEANREREAQGLPPVNALWLDGRCSGNARSPANVVISDDPAICGLAGDAASRPHARLPHADELAAFARSGSVLLDVGTWRAPRRAGDAGAWIDAWLALDQWLATLTCHGLPRGFKQVRAVLTGERRCLELAVTSGDDWCVWRRTAALTRALGMPGARSR